MTSVLYCTKHGQVSPTTAGTCPNCPNQIDITPLSGPPTLPNQGWLCPACGRGNAPFVMQCPCFKPKGVGEEGK